MKLNKYIGLAALAVAFSACQDDMLEGGKQQNGIYTLSGKMAGGAAMSRAQIELGNTDGTKEIFMWNEGDAFALYQNIDDNLNTSVFSISDDYREDGEDRKSAAFTTNNPAELGVEYVAVFPAGLTVNADGKVDMNFNGNHLDFTGATTEAERAATWKTYMSRYMYMLAKGTLVDGVMNVVSFEHLCAMFRVSYSNETEETKDISSLSFSDNSFFNGITYDLKGRCQSGMGSTGNYSTTFSGLIVKPGETIDLYVFLFPGEFKEGEVKVNLNINSETKSVVLPTSTIAEANNGVTAFEAGKRYWFKVTETADGLVWSKNFKMETVTINNQSLSLALLNALGEDKVSLNDEGYAEISELVTKTTSELYFGEDSLLNSLEGLEVFTGLKKLTLSNTGVRSLDLGEMHQLEELHVFWNELTDYDLSTQSELKSLSLEGCGLQGSLDLSAFTSLERLVIDGNDVLTDIVYPQASALKELNIAGLCSWATDEKVAAVCSMYPNLEYLNAHNNGLTKLDLSGLTGLKHLHCFDNRFTEVLDVSVCTLLETLACGYSGSFYENSVTVRMTEAQKTLWHSNWMLSGWANNGVVIEGEEELVVIQNSELASALQAVLGADTVTIDSDYGYGIIKKDIVLSVAKLDFEWGKYTITSLSGIEFFKNLETLICNGTGLSYCNLSQNTALRTVELMNNYLTGLDFNSNLNLEMLNVGGNSDLASLNIDDCKKLFALHVNDTDLTSLTVPSRNILRYFSIGYTDLSYNWDEFESLEGLNCEGHDFEALNLSAAFKQHIWHLSCDYCGIDVLDLSEYSNLLTLSCCGNNLTELDLSLAPQLTNLNCYSNQIQSLDITPLANLGGILCGIQKNDIQLSLTLTSAQKELWDGSWNENSSNLNENVTLNVVESSTSGGNVTSGGDFTIEGIY